jgi:hypothetical protein
MEGTPIARVLLALIYLDVRIATPPFLEIVNLRRYRP